MKRRENSIEAAARAASRGLPPSPEKYLCFLWDNCASVDPVSKLERRLVGMGLITVNGGSGPFGHVTRRITDAGRKKRDGFVAGYVSALPESVFEVLGEAHRRVPIGKLSLNQKEAIRRGLVSVRYDEDGQHLALNSGFGFHVYHCLRLLKADTIAATAGVSDVEAR